jgi:hypothetical protein
MGNQQPSAKALLDGVPAVEERRYALVYPVSMGPSFL